MSHINCTRACDLTANQIGDAGATQLADALQRNSTLTDLELWRKHGIYLCYCCHHLLFVFIVMRFLIHPIPLFHMRVDFACE